MAIRDTGNQLGFTTNDREPSGLPKLDGAVDLIGADMPIVKTHGVALADVQARIEFV